MPSTDAPALTPRAFTTLTPEEIAAAYNVAYAEYVVPFVVDADWARSNVLRHDIDPATSYVWYTAGGDPAALAVLGIRGHAGWIGGFGIAKEMRGQGLSGWLIAETIANARAAGVHQLWLEVITTNAAAIRVYERAGFAHTRQLLVLRTPTEVDTSSTQMSDAEAAQAHHPEPVSLQTAAERRSTSTDRPAWQRALPRAAFDVDHEQTLAYEAWDLAGANGGLVTTGSGDARRLADLWADDADSAGRLLAAVHAPLVARPAMLVNEPEDSTVANAALATGWTVPLMQHEMVLTLD